MKVSYTIGDMYMKTFDKQNEKLVRQFDNICYIEDSGVSEETLTKMYEELMENKEGLSKAILKAKTFEMILSKSRIALDIDDIFQDKVFGAPYMGRQRDTWLRETAQKYLAKETEENAESWGEAGASRGGADFGHTSPNSKLLLELGFTGILSRVQKYASREGLTDKQKEFYKSCEIVLSSMIEFSKRMANAIEPYNKENATVLNNISERAPQNIYEAMQTIILYFFLHEYIAGTRVRTLGRLDVLLYPYYKKDIENGTYTKEEIKEMMKFFLHKFWSAKVPFDLPFCLSGMDENGNDVTNEITYLIVETYNELDIHSPKIHIRVCDNTPEDFIKLVLRCIRGGNSSFVFVNDKVAMKSLVNVGIEKEDVWDYVPIGCYEPAVWGKEIGCTGNGGLNLAKAVEFVVTNGLDHKSGKVRGVKTGKIESYDDFVRAVKVQIECMAQRSMHYITEIEKHYDEIFPDPIHSAMYDDSIEQGIDVYEGGAKYNNSSMYYYFIATLVDSMTAVKKIVFEDKIVTFDEMCEILKNNWEGNEKLRAIVRNMPEKYGNNNPVADEITKDITDFCASLTNNRPNGRGGVFKASCFSIDRGFPIGEKTMATPDGRYAGEPLSKNLCASTAMDKNGVTALINSVTKIDHSKFPNGTVLDVVLHPSAVSGEDGLDAFYGILKTYMNKGGLAMHGNVFNPEILKEAQKYPEKYSTLQVRVCGWNAYFVNLSKAEQDAFIKQAENAM